MLGMYTQAPAPGASGKFANSEKLPSLRSGYGCREIPDLWSANLETAQYVCAISELRNTFAQYICTICERNGLTGWERPSWLTEESWELSEMVMPWTGAAQSQDWHAIWGFCAAQSRDCAIPRLRGTDILGITFMGQTWSHNWHWILQEILYK